MLLTIVVSIAIVLLLFAGMAIGVLMGRAPVKGSCGGLGAVGVRGDCGVCGRKVGEACAKERLGEDAGSER